MKFSPYRFYANICYVRMFIVTLTLNIMSSPSLQKKIFKDIQRFLKIFYRFGLLNCDRYVHFWEHIREESIESKSQIPRIRAKNRVCVHLSPSVLYSPPSTISWCRNTWSSARRQYPARPKRIVYIQLARSCYLLQALTCNLIRSRPRNFTVS